MARGMCHHTSSNISEHVNVVALRMLRSATRRTDSPVNEDYRGNGPRKRCRSVPSSVSEADEAEGADEATEAEHTIEVGQERDSRKASPHRKLAARDEEKNNVDPRGIKKNSAQAARADGNNFEFAPEVLLHAKGKERKHNNEDDKDDKDDKEFELGAIGDGDALTNTFKCPAILEVSRHESFNGKTVGTSAMAPDHNTNPSERKPRVWPSSANADVQAFQDRIVKEADKLKEQDQFVQHAKASYLKLYKEGDNEEARAKVWAPIQKWWDECQFSLPDNNSLKLVGTRIRQCKEQLTSIAHVIGGEMQVLGVVCYTGRDADCHKHSRLFSSSRTVAQWIKEGNTEVLQVIDLLNLILKTSSLKEGLAQLGLTQRMKFKWQTFLIQQTNHHYQMARSYLHSWTRLYSERTQASRTFRIVISCIKQKMGVTYDGDKDDQASEGGNADEYHPEWECHYWADEWHDIPNVDPRKGDIPLVSNGNSFTIWVLSDCERWADVHKKALESSRPLKMTMKLLKGFGLSMDREAYACTPPHATRGPFLNVRFNLATRDLSVITNLKSLVSRRFLVVNLPLSN
ncbi:hypothetical protein BU15DRAFT_67233 [Melanogaster broomeanus]|nr:hypothetical protein BU15DRAFT_67233 [Melanogaster broomeanus]